MRSRNMCCCSCRTLVALGCVYVTIYVIASFLHIFLVPLDQQTAEASARARKQPYYNPLVKRQQKLKLPPNVLMGVAYMDPFKDQDLNITAFNVSDWRQAPVPLGALRRIQSAAVDLQHETNQLLPIFVLFINYAYLSMTTNWLCNLQHIENGEALLNRTLIVATSGVTCMRLSKLAWNKSKCVSYMSPVELNSALRWGKRNYRALLRSRLSVMKALVEANVTYVLVESDALWLRDPTFLFLNATLIDDADIVVPQKGYPDNGCTLAFDPMLVYPTNGTLALFQKMVDTLEEDEQAYDQDVMDSLCRSQYNGVVCRTFEWTDIADGRWFKMSEEDRKLLRPYIVNNNYYVGVDNKATRAAVNGLWFVSSNQTCQMARVQKMLLKYT